MMKNIALLATLVIVLVASSSSAMAAPIIYGYVSGSVDGMADSYGRDITICKEGTSNCVTGQVGIDGSTGLDYTAAPGGGDPLELYILDCEALNVNETNNIVITVPDNGSGYYAGPETVPAIDTSRVDLTLAKDCTNEDSVLSVSTDQSDYYPLDTVTITAHFEDDSCMPLAGEEVGIEVNGAGAEQWACQDTTNDYGDISCEMGLAANATPGTWTVDASVSGDGYYNDTTFDVLACYDNDDDGFAAVQCGGTDCNDADPTSNPGAQELCDGIDNDCDGVTDNFSQTCGTDTGACVSGTQTCTDGVWGSCVGSVGPTAEVCDGVDNNCNGQTDEGVCGGGGGGGGIATDYCGNLFCDTNENCTTCPGDCGECETAPPSEGTQCVPDWSCTAWSDCSPEGLQTRTCTDLNQCEGAFTPPDTEQTCVYTAPAGEGTQGAGVTGQFLGVPLTSLYLIAIIVMVLVAAGGIFFWKKK